MADSIPLKFGLVGCGNIGQRHAALIHKLGKLTAVCDVDSTKVENLAQRYMASAYSDLEILLKEERDLNALAICTPNYLHASQSIAGLLRGLHVICEKPMALHTDDCLKMQQAASESGKYLLIVKQNRFNPPVLYLKRLIESGSLGQIFSININCFWNRTDEYYSDSDWKGKLDKDGGILYTQFSHFFDAAIWLFGNMHCVAASGTNFNHQNFTNFEDTIAAIMKFENGGLGTMHFSTNAFLKNMEGSITVLGKRGAVSIGGEYLNKLTYHVVEDEEPPKLSFHDEVNDYGKYTGSMNNHASVYQQFLNGIHKADRSLNDLKISVYTVQAIESVYSKLAGSSI